ncbi:MAG: hypothetical protein COA78_37395 [Blastopirellula sp.]|nr:MAG: hypothetical protein COA78_37395 [Blastopirellula sp.]
MLDPKDIHLTGERTYTRPLFGVRFDPLGRFVVTGSQGNSVQRWNLADEKLVELQAHDSWVRAISHTHDGSTFFTGGYDGRIAKWNSESIEAKPVQLIQAHDGWLRSLDVSPDGSLIVSGGNDNLVKIWKAEDLSLIKTIEGHPRHVYRVRFHPDGKRVVSVGLMGEIFSWEVESGKQLQKYDGSTLHKFDNTFKADIGGSRSLDFSADGNHFACGGFTNVSNAFAGVGDALALIFDVDKEKPHQKLQPKAKFKGEGWGLRYHPDGFIIVCFSGGGGGKLCFFKGDTENEFFEFKLPTQCFDLDLSHDGKQLAIAGSDKKLRFYSLEKK